MNNQDLFFDGSAVSHSHRILYTPSPFAKESLLHLQETGELTAALPHSSERSGLISYLFFIVTAGSGSLTYQGRTLPLHTGDCVFIDCSSPYVHTTGADLWKLRWCHFSGPSMASIYAKYVQRGGQPAFRPGSPALFEQLLSALYATAESDDYIRDMKINEQLSSLLTLLMQASWQPVADGSRSGRQDIAQISAYLEAHYTEKITLDDLSQRFFINKFYMMRLFKEYYGLSISSALLRLRITRAKHLLRFSDKTVEQIGMECGLGPHSYFTRTFKKVEGIPPSEFRNQWKL